MHTLNWDFINAPVSVQIARPEWLPGRDWSMTTEDATMIFRAVLCTRPKVIVETGTFIGVGTRLLASALSHTQMPGASVDTIDVGKDSGHVDVTDEDWERLAAMRFDMLERTRRDFPRVTIREHLGYGSEVIPNLLPTIGGAWDFWLQDSSHFWPVVLAEWDAMQPFSRVGSVAVLDDIVEDHYLRKFSPPGWRTWWTPQGHCQLWLQRTE